MTFGEKLQKIRKEAGYSQEDLSFKLQVSRQAVSKWENDQGYPEIDKIIKMADIFDVTLDYFFNGSEDSDKNASKNEKGLYVSQEMASGYLLHQTLKYKKMAWAIALLLGGIAFVFLFSEIGALLYLMVMVASIALFVAILLAGNPYLQLKKEILLFDDVFKKELLKMYVDKKKKYQFLIIISVILFCISMFVLPVIGVELFNNWEDTMLAMSMILCGASVYLFVYSLGTLQSYRLLAENRDFRKEEK